MSDKKVDTRPTDVYDFEAYAASLAAQDSEKEN